MRTLDQGWRISVALPRRGLPARAHAVRLRLLAALVGAHARVPLSARRDEHDPDPLLAAARLRDRDLPPPAAGVSPSPTGSSRLTRTRLPLMYTSARTIRACRRSRSTRFAFLAQP